MKKTQETLPVHRGEVVTIEVRGLGHSGEGVARVDNYTVFVPGALPGETVEAEITEVKKHYSRGVVKRILTASKDRIEPDCPVYAACGGCQLQHLSYEAQLQAKHEVVTAAIERIGKLDDVTIHPVLPSPDVWHYRNKMQLPVGKKGSEVVVGCYAQASHEIVPMESCLIQNEANNRIAAALGKISAKFGLTPYAEKTRKGRLRYVLGRVGVMTGEVMAVLVTTMETLPEAPEIVAELRKEIPGLVSVIQNINGRVTNVMLGPKNKLLWGQSYIEDKLDDLTFRISPQSFFQVNTNQTVRLYNQALNYAALTGNETVIDAYCGTGTISLFLARRAKKVYGIEIVAPAIEDAKKNAAVNKIENVEFITGDATDVMPKLYKENVRPDVVVVDPPRAGCSEQVLDTFVAMKPKRIVYVSCNPASLARDLAHLAANGYETKEIQPVDMFPHTFHVESVAVIERK